MEQFCSSAGRITILLFLLTVYIIQDSRVEAVRGGGSRSHRARHGSYYMYHESNVSPSYSRATPGAVAGVVVGCIAAAVFIVGVIILVYVFCRRTRSRQVIRRNGTSPPPYNEPPVGAYYIAHDNKGMEMPGLPPEYFPKPPPYEENSEITPPPPPYEQSKHQS